jgi:excisionase family DNA binding protein
MALAVPPELVERIAERAAELLAERLEPVEHGWMNVEEAANYIGCRPSRIYALTSFKPARIPFERDGSRLLFKRSALDAWVRAGGGKRP